MDGSLVLMEGSSLATVSVYPTQFPQHIAIYECFPKSGWRIYNEPKQRTQKIKQSSQTTQESKGDLTPKVTPLLKLSPAESPVL